MSNQELEYRALNLLEKNPDLTQRQLASELGISLGKTHYLIKSLVDVGWIKFGNFKRSKSKWRYTYLLTPKGISEKTALTVRFLAKKQKEYVKLQDEILRLKKEIKYQKNKFGSE